MMIRPAQFTPLSSALEQLGPHDHLCSIYENRQEHLAAAISFIQVGLARGEKCVYIADDGKFRDIHEALQAQGIDVDWAVASKSLVWITAEQAYLKPGSLDLDWMFSFWKETPELALSERFSALRAIDEREWVLKGTPGFERWIEYESRLTHSLSQTKCLVLCQ